MNQQGTEHRNNKQAHAETRFAEHHLVYLQGENVASSTCILNLKASVRIALKLRNGPNPQVIRRNEDSRSGPKHCRFRLLANFQERYTTGLHVRSANHD